MLLELSVSFFFFKEDVKKDFSSILTTTRDLVGLGVTPWRHDEVGCSIGFFSVLRRVEV